MAQARPLPNAVIESAGYVCRCPRCNEPIPAPESTIGRTMWTLSELVEYRRVYCLLCDTACAIGDDAEMVPSKSVKGRINRAIEDEG